MAGGGGGTASGEQTRQEALNQNARLEASVAA